MKVSFRSIYLISINIVSTYNRIAFTPPPPSAFAIVNCNSAKKVKGAQTHTRTHINSCKKIVGKIFTNFSREKLLIVYIYLVCFSIE